MNSFNAFLVVVVVACLTYQVSAEDAKSNATITFSATPDKVKVGTAFSAKCVIDKLDATKFVDFSVNFNFEKTPIANYFGNLTKGSETGFAVFTASADDSKHELVATQVNSTFPHFEVNLKPTGNNAVGKYSCSITLKPAEKSANETTLVSGEWNGPTKSGSSAILPSLMMLAIAFVVGLRLM